MNAQDVVLYGVSGITLVMLVVQAAKVAGLPDKWAPLAALISGVLVAGGVIANEYWPNEVGPWIRLVVLALLLGLAGSGLYAHTQATQEVVNERATAKALADAPAGSQTVVVPSSTVPAVGLNVENPTQPQPEHNLTGSNMADGA